MLVLVISMQFIHYICNFWSFIVNYNDKYQSMLVNKMVIKYNIIYKSIKPEEENHGKRYDFGC